MKNNPLYESERIKAIAYFDEKDVRDKIEKDKEKRKKRRRAIVSAVVYACILVTFSLIFNKISLLFV